MQFYQWLSLKCYSGYLGHNKNITFQISSDKIIIINMLIKELSNCIFNFKIIVIIKIFNIFNFKIFNIDGYTRLKINYLCCWKQQNSKFNAFIKGTLWSVWLHHSSSSSFDSHFNKYSWSVNQTLSLSYDVMLGSAKFLLRNLALSYIYLKWILG